MKPAPLVMLLLLLSLGCAVPPPAPKELPQAASRNYDLLWQATLNTVEKHFELWVKNKEQGYMVSTYKRGEPFPGTYLSDAQTGYDALEELMHIVRRRLTARILEDSPGVYVLHLEIIRERQGYVPPPGEEYTPPYNLYDQDKTALEDTADQKETVTWYRLGRDMHLEKSLTERIQHYLKAHRG